MMRPVASHPSDAELQGYRRRELSPSDLLRVDDHVAGCEHCRGAIAPAARAEAAAALRAALAIAPVVTRGRRLPSRWWPLAAALLVLGLTGAWFLVRRHPERPTASAVIRARPATGADARLGTPALPARATRLVRRAIDTGALWLDPGTLALVEGASRSRGHDDRRRFALVSPVAVSVASERPVFRWSPLRGATAYVVTISDATFREVVESPPVTASEWRAQAAFARGRVYVWQVTARTHSGETTVPGPVEPAARFHVLEASRLRELEEGTRAAKDSPLALAALLAADGLFDDAESELVALAAREPDDALVRRLLEDLRRRRRGERRASNGPLQRPPDPSSTKPAQ
jgi:hypothetical protein